MNNKNNLMTLMMDVADCSETLLPFNQTKRHNIPNTTTFVSLKQDLVKLLKPLYIGNCVYRIF
jgi:hypothetical protein